MLLAVMLIMIVTTIFGVFSTTFPAFFIFQATFTTGTVRFANTLLTSAFFTTTFYVAFILVTGTVWECYSSTSN